MSEIFLFAGPTLHRALAIKKELPLCGIEVRPPMRRGDLPRAIAKRQPGVVVLVDGVFHSFLAVGHAEIRSALAAGWSVWGLSSMGAIRAREMMHMGMRGYGEVFALYCQPDVDFRDDEVTLLHEDEPPYREASEPLVHLRAALSAFVKDGLVTEAVAATILDELSQMWFGARTLGLFRARLFELVKDRAAELDARLRDFDRYRVKSHDLIRFLDERPFD